MGALRIGSVRLDKTFSFTKFADNRYLAFGIDDIIRIWDIVSEELKLTMQFQGDIAAIDYSPDSQKIAVCANGAAIIYEVRKKRI
jgi:WD40 repeat protein